MAAWGWGYLNTYYLSMVPHSWLQSITAYHVNKYLGILTPRHERRYFRILATIENCLTFGRRLTFIILIHSLQLMGYFNHYFIKYGIVPHSWLESITAYHVNKYLGILTLRH